MNVGQYCSILLNFGQKPCKKLAIKSTIMAKVSLYHDNRSIKPGNPGTVKIKCHHKGTTIMLPTSVRIHPEQWTGKTVINHPRAKQWNNYLDLRIADITSEILKIELAGHLQSLTPAELRSKLLAVLGHTPAEETPATFLSVYEEYVGSMKNEGTKGIWRNTLNRISAFCDDQKYKLDKLTFQDVTVEWMQEFDTFLAKTAPKANARAINHRNIRALFNYAIKKKKMAIPYPFAEFKIKHQETAHIDLTIEQTRLLAEYPVADDHIRKYRDIFLLMIYLRGINSADLFGAKKDQIIDGRLEYYRRKTGAFTSVKIEPEAQAIMNKYAGKEYLLDIAENWQDPKNYLRRMDKGLKQIGPVTVEKHGKKTYHGLFQRISSNSARHTWGSLLFDLGYSIDISSEGLTHKYGSRTTNIYVHKRQQKIVDKANRELIDYILKPDDIALDEKELA